MVPRKTISRGIEDDLKKRLDDFLAFLL